MPRGKLGANALADAPEEINATTSSLLKFELGAVVKVVKSIEGFSLNTALPPTHCIPFRTQSTSGVHVLIVLVPEKAKTLHFTQLRTIVPRLPVPVQWT
jgi:hypothetical protein